MADNKEVASGGLGLGTILGIIFIVLKLTETITWSWIWVLSPFWIPTGFVLAIAGFIFLGAFILKVIGR